jgi:hypothetical protein
MSACRVRFKMTWCQRVAVSGLISVSILPAGRVSASLRRLTPRPFTAPQAVSLSPNRDKCRGQRTSR